MESAQFQFVNGMLEGTAHLNHICRRLAAPISVAAGIRGYVNLRRLTVFKDAEIRQEYYEETHTRARSRGMTVRRKSRDIPSLYLGDGAYRTLPTPRLDQYDVDPQD